MKRFFAYMIICISASSLYAIDGHNYFYYGIDNQNGYSKISDSSILEVDGLTSEVKVYNWEMSKITDNEIHFVEDTGGEFKEVKTYRIEYVNYGFILYPAGSEERHYKHMYENLRSDKTGAFYLYKAIAPYRVYVIDSKTE